MQNLVALVLLLVHLQLSKSIWEVCEPALRMNLLHKNTYHPNLKYTGTRFSYGNFVFCKKLNLTNCGIHILKKFIENCNANSCDNSDIHYTAQLKFQEVSAKWAKIFYAIFYFENVSHTNPTKHDGRRSRFASHIIFGCLFPRTVTFLDFHRICTKL